MLSRAKKAISRMWTLILSEMKSAEGFEGKGTGLGLSFRRMTCNHRETKTPVAKLEADRPSRKLLSNAGEGWEMRSS